jgi:hypothetical protein
LDWLVGNLGAPKLTLEDKKEREDRLSTKDNPVPHLFSLTISLFHHKFSFSHWEKKNKEQKA